MRTTNAVFSTLTFPHDSDKRDAWLGINESTNRYVQRVRRKVDFCEYLKTYEIHKDGYPHAHFLFLFRNFHYPANHSRWLPSDVFQKLKSSWTHGLSDHQQPIANSSHSALAYILKYVSKNSSSSHLWSKLLGLQTDVGSPDTNELGYPIRKPKYASYKVLLVTDTETLTHCVLKEKKIKLISWSRGFVDLYLKSKHSKKPCPNRA